MMLCIYSDHWGNRSKFQVRRSAKKRRRRIKKHTRTSSPKKLLQIIRFVRNIEVELTNLMYTNFPHSYAT